MPKVSVVVPTFNERENIEPLVTRLDAAMGAAGLAGDYELIIVDDDSPDGTAEVVRELISTGKYPIRLLTGSRKDGLGSAYRRGFREAKGDIIFEMDADLSHDPLYIKDFIHAIEKGGQMVVGSRYIKGGKVPDWSFHRRLISKGGNLFARFWLGLSPKDVTSGYKAYKRECIDLVLDTKCEGYVFQIETQYLAKIRNVKVVEVPIVFLDRKRGKSKLGTKEIIAFWKAVFSMKKRWKGCN